MSISLAISKILIDFDYKSIRLIRHLIPLVFYLNGPKSS